MSIGYRFQLQKVFFISILVIPLISLIIYGPAIIFILLIIVITFAALREFYILANGTTRSFSTEIIFGSLIGSGITLGFGLRPELQVLAILLGISASLVFELVSAYVSSPNSSFSRFNSFLASWFYIAIPLGYIIKLRLQPNGVALLLILLVLGMASSVSAGYVGRLFGRNYFPKTINVKKTFEGTISGILVTGFLFIFLNHLVVIISVSIHWQLMIGLLLGVAAQVGDLGKSALKRISGVADSGTFIPAVGGILDLVDSYLLMSPLLYYML